MAFKTYEDMMNEMYFGELNGSSSPSSPYVSGSTTPKMSASQKASFDEAELAGSAAAGGAMGGPAGAAIMVGSQFLTQYLAQKAADERARRERAAQIAQQHGQDEQKGFDQLINVYRGALR